MLSIHRQTRANNAISQPTVSMADTYVMARTTYLISGGDQSEIVRKDWSLERRINIEALCSPKLAFSFIDLTKMKR